MMGLLRRTFRWIFKGVPERKVFVNVNQIEYGGILSQKTALVTGGGSGIGAAIAKKLYSEGAKVLICGRDEKKLREVSLSCKGSGEILFSNFDLLDFAHLEEHLDEAKEKLGGIVNILINNAGIWENVDIRNADYNIWDNIMDTNLKAPYFVAKNVIGSMGEGDSIIFTSSENGQINCSNPYGMSKAALDRLVGGLAKEYVRQGIRVNAVAPGPTVSGINLTKPETGLQRGDQYRVLLPEEIAEIVCFLISDAAKSVNGQIIYCDEGDHLR